MERIKTDRGAIIINNGYNSNIDSAKSSLNVLSLFKDKIKVFHIKDFIVENDKLVQVGIGKGIMGWDKMLPKIYSVCPNAFLVFEGVSKDDMVDSYNYFRPLMEALEK